MKNKRSMWLRLGFVVLTAAACGFPQLQDPVDQGDSAPFGLELLAGDIGGAGNVDGTGPAARFNFPFGVAVDAAGNVYVADQNSHTIRKLTPAGVVTTLAGTAGLPGSLDGSGADARFNFPFGLATDSAGNIYVADQSNHTIRKVTPAGLVTTLAGSAGVSGSADGTGAAARFNVPSGVAVDRGGDVYISDQNNHTIRKLTPAGVVTTLAGAADMAGSADGTGAEARFTRPIGVAVDGNSNVYVADLVNTIRKITPAGVVTTLAGTAGTSGSADGTGAAARFNRAFSLTVDTAGNVYVTDQANHTLRKVTATGVATTLAGSAGISGSADGTGGAARFSFPSAVAVDSTGSLYVADRNNQTIRKVTAARVVTTLAGTPGVFGRLFGVTVDRAGNIYGADLYNHTIRKVTRAGVVTTLAGSAGMAGSADGTGADARFNIPFGLGVDRADNIYVADQNNHTLRKITAAGVVTTLAGTAGMAGSLDGTGADARLFYPTGVAIDSAGNVYVADQYNHTIRKVTAAGVVTTLAGAAGISGTTDGTGRDARFYFPSAVAVDRADNVYVADQYNHTIRKVTATGVVTTLAGTGGMFGNADGTGGDARFNVPSGVAVDRADNVYVADSSNCTIRKVTPAGATTTVAGTTGVAGIILGATPRFAFPVGVTIIGDSIVIGDGSAILLLRHGAQ